uniref:Uncharacterized protein n=1 Tax=Oryza meridionalis TaxID=40149 RepID=A0A0E0D3U3_9ORYZ
MVLQSFEWSTVHRTVLLFFGKKHNIALLFCGPCFSGILGVSKEARAATGVHILRG